MELAVEDGVAEVLEVLSAKLSLKKFWYCFRVKPEVGRTPIVSKM